MKKLKVKIPGGGTLEVDEFETEIEEHTTAAEYSRRLEEEERYDRKLDELAREIADRMATAEIGGRALEYWQVGKLMLQHEMQLEAKAREAGLREYESRGKTRQRLMDKLSAIREERGAEKEKYSPNYLRKFIRHARLFREDQASRPVHYSLQHELLYDWLEPADRDAFLGRCEKGEFKVNSELRKAVAELGRARGVRRPTIEERSTDVERA